MQLVLRIDDMTLPLRLHLDRAPKTCASLLRVLPFENKIIHGRWSGEACWVPLGELDWGVEPENQTTEPAPGQILFHPNGISEAEILVPYGKSKFACKHGPLFGNHFATVDAEPHCLFEVGERVLYEGVKAFAIYRP